MRWPWKWNPTSPPSGIRGREGGEFRENNLRGILLINQRLNKNARPVLRIKNKGGAPRGNRNALKHGQYTAESLAQWRAAKKEFAAMKLICVRIDALAAQAWLATQHRKPNVIVERVDLVNGERLARM